MITIFHVITRLDMGGSAQNTLKTCLGLAGGDRRVVLVCGASRESNMTADERQAGAANLEIAAGRGVVVAVLPTLIRRIDPLMDTLALVGLMRIIRRERPQIVHTHTSKAGILGRLAAWLLRVPVVTHTPHGHVFHGHFSRLLSKVFLIIERIFDKITDCTIALTDGELNDYIRKSVSKPDKLVKIHSGVDIPKFIGASVNGPEKKKTFGIGVEEAVVGTVGWLLPIKGPTYLMAAMGQVWVKKPDVRMMFVGKGELETELKTMARSMGAGDKTLFTGWRDDAHEIMPVFDIFVLPSLNEGMGRVIVEAMAAGKPVVASNTGGIPDLVIDGETGFLVEPGDPAGLASAINKLLEDPDLRSKMGQAGRKRCHLFSEALMIEKIDKLYQRLLN